MCVLERAKTEKETFENQKSTTHVTSATVPSSVRGVGTVTLVMRIPFYTDSVIHTGIRLALRVTS